MDSSRSIIYDQSENRLHTEKGILVWLLYPRLKRPTQELRAYHAEHIQAFLDGRSD
jgi:putrescine carbamoyltransferase